MEECTGSASLKTHIVDLLSVDDAAGWLVLDSSG